MGQPVNISNSKEHPGNVTIIGSGSTNTAKVNSENSLFTTDMLLEAARGNVSGIKMYSIPGRKNALSSTVLDDITQIPSTTVVPTPGGIQLEAVSDGDDTSGGVGALTIDLHYLDTAGAEQVETITMNGVTPVNTVATDIDFVQWAHTKTVGSSGVADGNISIRNTAGTVTYEYIAAGGNQSLSAKYKIPTGKKGYIVGWHCSGITKRIDFRLRATVERFDRSLISDVFLFQDSVVLQDAASGWIPFEVPLQCAAGSIVKISGISDAAGGDAGAAFSIVVIDD